ncbi:hypothetical protein [Legionella sp. 16cNR16C]|uniref:hypothetical protein n=1 Tax=Legionella sp. 16cNR16C TaxID=2905656 RepID=UPI001E602AEE|nr:hypothetical protein [Legionella sp. 16cNR16C]MCE3044067.1 hypothetical protein [Legionella sp. 16cNR16C]
MFFQNKTNIAVIGGKKSGKTALIKYLCDAPFSTGELPSLFFRTRQIPGSHAKFNFYELSSELILTNDSLKWNAFIKDIDILIYCIDLPEFLKPDQGHSYEISTVEAMKLSTEKSGILTFVALTNYDKLDEKLTHSVDTLERQLIAAGFNTFITSAKPDNTQTHSPSRGAAGIRLLRQAVENHLETQPIDYAISLLNDQYPELKKALRDLHTALNHLPVSERNRIENETVNLVERFTRDENISKLAAINYYQQTCTKILYDNADSSFRWRKWYSRVLFKILLISVFIMAATMAGFVVGLALGAKMTGPGALFIATFGAVMGALAGIYLATRLPFDQFLSKFSFFSPKEEVALGNVIKAAMTANEEEMSYETENDDPFKLV